MFGPASKGTDLPAQHYLVLAAAEEPVCRSLKHTAPALEKSELARKTHLVCLL